jgi:K+-sensing histidine kinase KdpD
MDAMARRDERSTNTLVGLALGALAPIAVALVLVPFREELVTANLALILVLTVVAVAIGFGRRAAAVAAISATFAFDFFLVRPYLTMEIESADDIETVLILLGVGLLVGWVASRRRESERGREHAAESIVRVHRVADRVAQGVGLDEVAKLVTTELSSLLSLNDCWLEFRPFVYVMPVLERGGSISDREQRYADGGLTLSQDGVALPVLERGEPVARLVLIGDPTEPVTLEDRVVAVALADQLGSALALAPPAEREQLVDASRRD